MDLKWWHLLLVGLVVVAGVQSKGPNNDDETDEGPDQDKTGSCYTWDESLKGFKMHKAIEKLEEHLEEQVKNEVASGEQQELEQQLEEQRREWQEYTNRIMKRCLKKVNLSRLGKFISPITEEMFVTVMEQMTKKKNRLSFMNTPEKLMEYFSLMQSVDERLVKMMREEQGNLFREAIESKNLDLKDLEWDCVVLVDSYKLQMMLANRWSRVQSMSPEQVNQLLIESNRDLYALSLYTTFCQAILSADL